MNIIKKLAVVLGLALILSPIAAFAKTMEQSYLENYQARPTGAPVPVTVVAPTVSYTEDGSVELSFTVDASGKPSDITVKSATSANLVRPVVDAVAQWKFEPARVNGEAVAKKVILPVHFVSAE